MQSLGGRMPKSDEKSPFAVGYHSNRCSYTDICDSHPLDGLQFAEIRSRCKELAERRTVVLMNLPPEQDEMLPK